MIKAGQHYMPTGGNKGLVVILGESVDKEHWIFSATFHDGATKDSQITKEHLVQEIEKGRFKLIYDPPDKIDYSIRNRLAEIGD